MKKKPNITEQRSDMPKGKLKRVKDFLPSPGTLVFPKKNTKGTVSLKRTMNKHIDSLLNEDQELLKRLAKS